MQRRLEFTLAPALVEWTVVCYLDLETRSQHARAASRSTASSTTRSRAARSASQKADRDPQASLYLAGRWLESRPADEFAFAQIAKPGRQRRQMSAALIDHPANARAAARSPGTDRARRREIDAYYRRFGA